MADVSQTIHNPMGIPIKSVKSLSASATLTREDDGKLIVFDSTTSVTATLPNSRKGYTFHFYVRQVTTTAGHTVTPQTGDTIYFSGGGAHSASTSAQCSAASDVVGDGLTLVGDGNGGYFALYVKGTWARV